MRGLVNTRLSTVLPCVFHCQFLHRMVDANTKNGLPPLKMLRAEPLSIGTHNGTFHADEVLACWLLRRLPRFEEAKIVRTRDQKQLDACDVVVDVGGEFDADRLRFDHHQKSFELSLSSLLPQRQHFVTKLSSAGLVWAHFGHDVIASLTGLSAADRVVELLFEKMYEKFVEEIDAGDNGIAQVDGGDPKFSITTTIGSRVAHLNPCWNSSAEEKSDAGRLVRFGKAMALMGAEFEDRLNYLLHSWLPARDIVKQSLLNREKIDPSGRIMVFETSGCPWKEHLFELEKEFEIGVDKQPWYVLFQDEASISWRVNAVPPGPNTFTLRHALPEGWRGLRDEQLSHVSGVADCIFCHINGFIGGNKSYAGVLEMARAAVAA